MSKKIDLVGKNFGSLIVLEEAVNKIYKRSGLEWLCSCVCGKTRQVHGNCLKRGDVTHCGNEIHRIIDLNNKIFGQLTVLSYAGNCSWNCECKCTNKIVVTGALLRGGGVKSCGCWGHSEEFLRQNKWKRSPAETSAKVIYSRRYDDGDISFEEFFKLSQLDCFYCGASPSNKINSSLTRNGASKISKEQGDFIYNGLDRVDNSKNHTKDNCVTCCSTCNYAKRMMPQDVFFEWVGKIYSNLKKKSLI